MKERIQKVLAAAGVASRRDIEEAVRQGRVAVNGRVLTDLPILIDPEIDKVKLDDEPIPLKGRGLVADKTRPGAGERLYFLMHKPKGVYSTNEAQGAQTRAIDLLPPEVQARNRLFPVGRLDAESKGLLLLTNDGEMTNKLTHPRYGVPKTYKAVVDGYVQDQSLDILRQGVWLADKHSGEGFKTGRAHVRIDKRLGAKTVLEITLREGRNREVRRMLAKVGHKVRDLTRVRMGPLTLEKLKVGEVRQLTPREVKELLRAVDELKPRPRPATEPSADGKPPRRPVREPRPTRAAIGSRPPRRAHDELPE
ncbi:MAG TPA: pseudouridine synthase [Tepidisphaeraceae bacterium]|nr:pseudouridine synthase [Tepidisphaeraceae bacterium]